jgi:hypothetical protein
VGEPAKAGSGFVWPAPGTDTTIESHTIKEQDLIDPPSHFLEHEWKTRTLVAYGIAKTKPLIVHD